MGLGWMWPTLLPRSGRWTRAIGESGTPEGDELVGDYAGWSALMLGAKFVGISGREWVRWSVSDPHYARNERKIERMWNAVRAHARRGFLCCPGC